MKTPSNINLHQFDNLELLAKQVVEGFIIGLHKSPFHGFSVEFAEHRLYNNGDPIKNIDWKVFGRTDKLFIKRFEEETNLRCQIVIDCSSSMYFPQNKNEMSKIQFAAVASACFQYLLKKQRDAVGLSLFTNTIKYHVDARSSNTHHQLINSQLQQVIVSTSTLSKTATANCLHQIAENIHKRSLVVLFSDMMDNVNAEGMDAIFAALQHLKFGKHEVIVFDVADKKHEIDFDYDNRPYEFIDLETGEKVKLHANEIKNHYTTEIKKLKQQLRLKCLQYKIDLIETDINKGIEEILMPYLMKRQRML